MRALCRFVADAPVLTAVWLVALVALVATLGPLWGLLGIAVASRLAYAFATY
jgi:hypothetical protein